MHVQATDRQYWSDLRGKLQLRARPYIDGKFAESGSRSTIPKYSPSDGSVLMRIPEGDASDIDAAVRSARASFEDGRWSRMPVARRKDVLMCLAGLLYARRHELALIETVEVGKPIVDSLEIDLSLVGQVLKFNVECADKIFGQVVQPDDRSLGMTILAPRGVVGAIVGWNFPLLLAVMKLAPALVTGNSMVIKPSELSSLSTLKLAELALEAGVPPGVFNVVPGVGKTAGDALARHPDVDMISFTGSSEVGKRIMVAAGESNMKRLLLECGGKAPNIVFGDCPDLEGVVSAVAFRMFWNQGQVCTAGTRLLVDASLKERFLQRLVARLADFRVGDPTDPATNFGPLVSEPQMRKVLGYVDSGLRSGAELLAGGRRLTDVGSGYYVAPTIFDRVRPDMEIAQEEIFGPVLSVMSFTDVEEAIRIANHTRFGLSATVWTRDLSVAQRAMRDIRAGEIDIKATVNPTPGVAFGALPLEPHKESGFGAESGFAGLQSYLYTRSIRLFCD